MTSTPRAVSPHAGPTRLADAYFHEVWQEPDPWDFEDSWYEARKRDLTLAALPDQHVAHAFEPGCAQGILTARLATRCDRVTALDPVPEVAERARARVGDHADVEVRVGALPDDWPEDPVDLVVASEVLYYLSPAGLETFVDRLDAALGAGGALVAVHWRGPTDYPQTGDEVHERLDAVDWLSRTLHAEQDEFLLDTWVRS